MELCYRDWRDLHDKLDLILEGQQLIVETQKQIMEHMGDPEKMREMTEMLRKSRESLTAKQEANPAPRA